MAGSSSRTGRCVALACTSLVLAAAGVVGCGGGGGGGDGTTVAYMRALARGIEMYSADFDGYFPPGIVAKRRGDGSLINVASWRNLTLPYVGSMTPYESPTVRAALSLILDPGAASAVYWSEMDTVWVDCSPASKAFTGDLACRYSNGQFFRRSFTLNGAPFGVVFVVGEGPQRTLLCGECTSSIIASSGIPQADQTVLLINSKNVEPISLPGAIARCWQEMGTSGSNNQFVFADPTSPTGQRRRYSWFNVTNKAVQLLMADGHARLANTTELYDQNLLKYDCQRNVTDTRTWPANAHTPAECGGFDAPTCAARAKLLVSAEHL